MQYSTYEIMNLLEACGYDTSYKNVEILTEAAANGETLDEETIGHHMKIAGVVADRTKPLKLKPRDICAITGKLKHPVFDTDGHNYDKNDGKSKAYQDPRFNTRYDSHTGGEIYIGGPKPVEEEIHSLDSYSDEVILESISKYTPEHIIEHEAGIRSEGWSTFWGWFFLGIPGAVLFYLLRKNKNEDLQPRVKKLAILASKDPACSKIIAELKDEVAKEKPNKNRLKALRSDFSIKLKVLESKTDSLKESNDYRLSSAYADRRTARLLESYLVEDCKMPLKEAEDMSDTKKNASIIQIASTMIKNLSDKIMQVDTSVADKSKGDIKQLSNLDAIQTSVTKLEAMLDRAEDYYPACKLYLSEVIKTILYLNQYSSQFKEAYRNKKTLLIMKYETLILSIISSLSYLISTMVDFDSDTVKLIEHPQVEEIGALKTLRDFNKSVDSGEFKLVTQDVELIKENYSEFSIEESLALVESSDILGMVGNGLKNMYDNLQNNGKLNSLLYKATGAIALILSLRDATYSLTKMKTSTNDMIDGIKNFATENFGGALSKLSNFANKFKSDAEFSSELGTREVEDQNRKLATEIHAIPNTPIEKPSNAAPLNQVIDAAVPDATSTPNNVDTGFDVNF